MEEKEKLINLIKSFVTSNLYDFEMVRRSRHHEQSYKSNSVAQGIIEAHEKSA